MTKYLSAEHIIAINAEHGGEGAGVRELDRIEAAAARPSAGFGDFEEYPSLFEKAAVLLHGLASTQGFFDGNKRTAWIAADQFLRHNGKPLRPSSTSHREAFVLAVATGLLHDVTKIAEWFEDQALTARDRHDYSYLAINARFVEGAGTLDVAAAMVSGAYFSELPSPVSLSIVAHFRWLAADLFATRRVAFYVEDGGRDSFELQMPTDEVMQATRGDYGPDEELFDRYEFEHVVMPTNNHPRIPAGTPYPLLWVQRIQVVVNRPALRWFVLELDGEQVARIPFNTYEKVVVPDTLP